MHRVVIVGGGFGGLRAAKELAGKKGVEVTLIDERNFHLFQPLLYQVATGGLSPGDIASPLRSILKASNVRVLMDRAVGIQADTRRLLLKDGEIEYDTLIIATGVRHDYFGHDDWAQAAPGLKTVEDALLLRARILSAFELAEKEPDSKKRSSLLTFVIVGGGPTGVELAGALGELAHKTLRGEFRNFDPAEAKVVLLEGLERVLPSYPPYLSERARQSLARLGVTVRTSTFVTEVFDSHLRLRTPEGEQTIEAGTVLWAAGVRASSIGSALAQAAGAKLDEVGRILVREDLSVPSYPEILVVGDLAGFTHQGGVQLPGVAQVAIQQGRYAARALLARLNGKEVGRFRYRHKGSLAVIGRNSAVAEFGRVRFAGWFAWLLWAVVHIANLIGFENKVLVMIQWAWNYFTYKRGARLISGEEVRVDG